MLVQACFLLHPWIMLAPANSWVCHPHRPCSSLEKKHLPKPSLVIQAGFQVFMAQNHPKSLHFKSKSCNYGCSSSKHQNAALAFDSLHRHPTILISVSLQKSLVLLVKSQIVRYPTMLQGGAPACQYVGFWTPLLNIIKCRLISIIKKYSMNIHKS